MAKTKQTKQTKPAKPVAAVAAAVAKQTVKKTVRQAVQEMAKEQKARDVADWLKVHGLVMQRTEDTKNYAKFTFASRHGAFGSFYIPLAAAEGLTSLLVFGERE